MACEASTTISAQDISDLKSDISTIDIVVESNELTTTTKDAKTIDTLTGRLQKLGFQPPIPYVASIIFGDNDGTKTVEEASVIYAPLPSALPFTTSGTFIGDDDARFFTVQGIRGIDGFLFPFATYDAFRNFADIASMPIGTPIQILDRPGDIFYLKDEVSPPADDDAKVLLSLIDSTRFADRRHIWRVTAEMFGAIGDGPLTNDSASLTNCFLYSKTSGFPVYLSDKQYYAADGNINCDGAKIRSLSGVARQYSPASVAGIIAEYYLNSTPAGLAFTWAQYINGDVNKGCAIVSDFDGPILRVSDGFMFDIDGVGVSGDHRQTSQDGMSTDTPASYQGNRQKIRNCAVSSCGRHGINLQRGFEVSIFENNILNLNNGNGLFVGNNAPINSPVEFLTFSGCSFTRNRLDGVFLEHAKKGINFNGAQNNISGNGQYDLGSGITDLLLGYNRNIPALNVDMIAGFRIDDCDLDGTDALFGLNFSNVLGEQMAKGLHLRCKTGSGICRDVITGSNSFLRSAASFPGEAGVGYYFDVDFAANWVINPSERQSLSGYEFEVVPSTDPTNKILFLDDGIPTGPAGIEEVLKFAYPAPISSAKYIQSTGRVYSDASLLVRDRNEGTTHLFPEVGTDFTLSGASNTSNVVAYYTISAHHQGLSQSFGVYVIAVTRTNDTGSPYAIATLGMTPTSGFASAPTINTTTGEVTVLSSDAFRRFSLQRIDNILSNAAP